MALFAKLFERRSLSWNELYQVLTAGNRTHTGVYVDERKALRVAAVWSCVSILADTIAALPLHLYQETEQGKFRAKGHPLDQVLNRKANPWMTAYTLRQAIMVHLALWRNAVIQIERNGAGQVIGLWPLLPDRTSPKTIAGMPISAMGGVPQTALVYETQLPEGGTKQFRQDEILHIRGLTINGLEGISLVKEARETLGSILAMEEFGGRYFSNGANPGGIITTDVNLTPEQRKQVAQMVNEQVQGLRKAHELLVLSNGAKFTPIGVEPAKAQLVEQRRFEIEEVARFFKIPAYKLGLADKGMSYASVEQMQTAFIQEALLPWLVNIEQSVNGFVLTDTEAQTLYVKHSVDGLLRGDTQTRYQAYHFALTDGWLNRDEVRELEDRNPIPNGKGQEYLTQLNMGPAPAPGGDNQQTNARPQTAEQRAMRAANSRKQLSGTFRRLLTDAASRIVRAEVNDIRAAVKRTLASRSADDFSKWLDGYYADHPALIERHLRHVILAYCEAVQADVADELNAAAGMTPELEEFARQYVAAYAQRHVGSSLGQLRELLKKSLDEGTDPAPVIDERLTEWDQTRAEKIGRREATRGANAFAKAAYMAMGIMSLRWNTVGDSCPYCRSLHGKTVGINSIFVRQGETLSPEGAKETFTSDGNIGHPPLHDGCDCYISAG